MEDSSGEEEEGDDHSDSEGEDREVTVTEQELEGYRLFDVGILNQNMASQLACAFFYGTVQLKLAGRNESVNLLFTVRTLGAAASSHFLYVLRLVLKI